MTFGGLVKMPLGVLLFFIIGAGVAIVCIALGYVDDEY